MKESKKKLSYYAICLLAAQNRLDLIPDDYKIEWACDIRPGKVLDEHIAPEDLQMNRNSFPMPDDVRISGSYSVVVPDPYEEGTEELLDFGPVLIRTKFWFDKIDFYYYDSVGVMQVQEETERIINMLTNRTGYMRKEDYTFDAEFSIPIGTCKLYNLMVTGVDDDTFTHVYLDCDNAIFNVN